MSILTEVILRLRAMCPIFERRVGGTSKFSDATSKEGQPFGVPHCFVVPGEEDAEAASGNAIAQMVTQRFVTIVCVDNSVNREDGYLTAADVVAEARRQIRNALMGWEPVMWSKPTPTLIGMSIADEDLLPNSRADYFRFEGGQHLSMNTQRLWHAYEWSTTFMDAPEGDEIVRGFTEVTLNGTTPAFVQKSARIGKVTSLNGRPWPGELYEYDPVGGTIKRKVKDIDTSPMPSGKYVVWYEKPPLAIQKIYAEYYPHVLEQAGGDPANITLEMFKLASQQLEDGSIVDGLGFGPGGDA